MDIQTITFLLSKHRHPTNSAIPTTLTKQQIVSLVRSSLSPNQPLDELEDEIQTTLMELQAQGEVLAGTGNRYCIAPPTLLALERDNLTGLLFRGDRAYLALAHQVLKTGQSKDELTIRPKVYGFNRIRDCLKQVGIRLLTVADSINYLPDPRQPSKAVLRSPWPDNPFTISNWPNEGTIQQYIPQQNTSQRQRWKSLNYEKLQERTLLKLPTGEYLWFVDRVFYELDPDVAILAMFYKDVEMKCPLTIQWDEPQGKLNLSGVILPHLYAQCFWHLSKPDKERYRTRHFLPTYWPLVKKTFERLGCVLV